MSNKQFGAVFKPAVYGGPAMLANSYAGYPGWPDIRNPGNEHTNETAHEIMRKWDRFKTKRFEVFIKEFNQYLNTPWAKEWFKKTTPGIDVDSVKIIRCKLELIKRIMLIKLTGPKSLEDWVLLFMFYDNDLEIPKNITALLHPANSLKTLGDWMRSIEKETPITDTVIAAPRQNMTEPGNMLLPGFDELPTDASQNFYHPSYQWDSTGLAKDSTEYKENKTLRDDRYSLIPRGTSTRPPSYTAADFIVPYYSKGNLTKQVSRSQIRNPRNSRFIPMSPAINVPPSPGTPTAPSSPARASTPSPMWYYNTPSPLAYTASPNAYSNSSWGTVGSPLYRPPSSSEESDGSYS